MTALTVLMLLVDLRILESRDFSREAQIQAMGVTVHVSNPATGGGTGVLMGRNGPLVYLLTANHVVERAPRLEVTTYAAETYPKPAAVFQEVEVLAHFEPSDLAILRVVDREQKMPTVRLCPLSRLPQGKDFAALSVGCERAQAPRCVLETVTGPRRVRKPGASTTVLCWETPQGQAKGRSGGPLLDVHGNLIGIASGTGDGKGYYIHVEEIHTFLRRRGLDWLGAETETKRPGVRR